MSLLSKNKPTKRVNFEGGWVELQQLSKGVKDEIRSRLAGLYKELESINSEELRGKKELPDGVNMDEVLKKINDVEYYKLSKAIKKWSEPDLEVIEETVKELDDEIFAEISSVVDEMNTLNTIERKN